MGALNPRFPPYTCTYQVLRDTSVPVPHSPAVSVDPGPRPLLVAHCRWPAAETACSLQTVSCPAPLRPGSGRTPGSAATSAGFRTDRGLLLRERQEQNSKAGARVKIR